MVVKLDWERAPRFGKANREFLAEATRQGHCYLLVVEGYDHPSGEGTSFVAPNEEEAKKRAHFYAHNCCSRVDRDAMAESGEIFDYNTYIDYPNRPYKLYHRASGRVVKDYKPPTQEDVMNGNVEWVIPEIH